MPVIHLGVVDVPYRLAPKKGSKRRNPPGRLTTGDVAQMLEGNYGIMQAFYDRHAQEIATDLEEGLQGALENLLLGGPPSANAFGTAEGKIDDAFRKALDAKEYDGQLLGVPTQAALRGVSHRFKRPYQRRPERPSFIDTGLYQSSFKAWVD